jgi:hypothetical protein
MSAGEFVIGRKCKYLNPVYMYYIWRAYQSRFVSASPRRQSQSYADLLLEDQWYAPVVPIEDTGRNPDLEFGRTELILDLPG